MDLFEHLCDKHKVIVTTGAKLLDKYGHRIYPCQHSEVLQQNSAVHFLGRNYILLNEGTHVITKWHELGHILHPLGGIQKYNKKNDPHHTIIGELAASYWALNNCDFTGDLYQESKADLLKAGITYTSDIRYSRCWDNDKYRILARKIGIEDFIHWETFGHKKTKWATMTTKEIFGC